MSYHVLKNIKRSSSIHRYCFFLLLLSGDIEINPGPIKNPCSICLKSVAKSHRAVNCDICNLWSHVKCSKISASEYQHLQSLTSFDFICSRCLMQELPNPELEKEFVPDNNRHFPLNLQPDDIEKLSTAKGLKIAHLNVNSLLKKIDDVRILVN